MGLIICLYQLGGSNVGVPLGGGDTGMSQHLLHRTNIGAICQHGSGKGMAEGVGRNGIVGALHPRVPGQDVADAPGGEGAAVIVQEQGGTTAPHRATVTQQPLLPLREILLQCRHCILSKKNPPILAALSPHQGGGVVGTQIRLFP